MPLLFCHEFLNFNVQMPSGNAMKKSFLGLVPRQCKHTCNSLTFPDVPLGRWPVLRPPGHGLLEGAWTLRLPWIPSFKIRNKGKNLMRTEQPAVCRFSHLLRGSYPWSREARSGSPSRPRPCPHPSHAHIPGNTSSQGA